MAATAPTRFEPEADLVARVDEAMAAWKQGDVAVGPWFAHLADARAPLTRVAREAASTLAGSGGWLERLFGWMRPRFPVPPGLVLVRSNEEGLVALTQTCDLVRTCVKKPFAEFAPLVRLTGGQAAEAARGWITKYAAVPGLGPDAFADLDRVLSFEKAIVADWACTSGRKTDDQVRAFGRAVGRRYSRFAFPDDFSERTIRPLRERLREKRGKPTAEGRAIERLEEIRVTAVPHWSAQSIEVFLSFLWDGEPRTRDLSDPEWDEVLTTWIGLCPTSGTISKVDGSLVSLGDFTARDYRDSDRLDLDALSP